MGRWCASMKAKDRDIATARRILREIDDVNGFLKGYTQEAFLQSTLLQKATVMSLLNMGEISKSFTEDFLDATHWIPWQDIRSARNIAAHTYDALDMDDVWETYQSDLPALRHEMEAAIRRLENGWEVAKEARKRKS